MHARSIYWARFDDVLLAANADMPAVGVAAAAAASGNVFNSSSECTSAAMVTEGLRIIWNCDACSEQRRHFFKKKKMASVRRLTILLLTPHGLQFELGPRLSKHPCLG